MSYYLNLLQLDNSIFKKGQDSIQQDLTLFVSAFDDTPTATPTSTSSPPSPSIQIVNTDQLTAAFVKLNACHSQLEVAKGKQDEYNQLLTDLKDVNQQVKQLQTIMSNQEHHNDIILSPIMEKKQKYLEEMKQRRLDRDREIQRKYDQLDEYYSKKTHESTYKNLVGSNHWLQGQLNK
ncbi:unnamed protein product [Cunninghamella blakesleeana]